MGGSLEEDKNLLFLKKKKQKDFLSIRQLRWPGERSAGDESFLVLFFKKEHAFFLILS
jgi:hypothetical protein